MTAVRKKAAPWGAGFAAVDVKPLRAAAKSMVSVTAGKNNAPILAGTLICSGPSTMTFCATDLDMELSCQIDLAESGTGRAMRAVVDASTLDKIVGKLPKEAQLTLAENGNTTVALACGSAQFDLPSLSADDFPTIDAGDWDAQFEIGRGELQALISAVRFAISTEETRYYLNGIFLQAVTEGAEAGHLLGAATDGHRMAQYLVPLPDGAEVMPDIIVSRKTIAVLDALLDAAEGGTVDIAVSTSKIRFEIGAVTLLAKLIDGQFPDHRRVIPTGNDKIAWVNPKDMIAALERVATVAEDKTRAVKITLAAGQAMTLEVSSALRGHAREEIGVDYAGDDLVIGFNGSYLIETLRHLTAEPALIKLGNPAGPTLFLDAEDSRRTYVLMPMRV